MATQQALEIIERAKEEARQLQAQVTTTSVMLANKTDYLMQLQEKLKTSDNNEYKRIAKEIKTTLTETDHWSDFIKNFNLLHSHYVDNIIKKHPDLTSNEVRLICFILSGLSNKEIAGIFSVEPESVKKARYRLKKKLNLTEEENLSFYLHNLR
jgi:DNA-binding CsgD family transcriptional regulator